MMAPPPTRKEQLALDELLSDIYRGIENLPDVDTNQSNINSNNRYQVKQQQVKDYELPSNSPLVQQHKRDIANLRDQLQSHHNDNDDSIYNTSRKQQLIDYQAPARSTLKRQQQQHEANPQSLASFITNEHNQVQGGLAADPYNNLNTDTQQHQNSTSTKRRVRIVEHPDKLAKQQLQQQQGNIDSSQYPKPGSPYARTEPSKPKVKYVNTNQLIYHEEPPLNGEFISNYQDSTYYNDTTTTSNQDLEPDSEQESSDSQDIDGVTKVEYYHTSWLDRQLGRASRRRSSNELNERQVKERAMIEELKRSLKNGAITLKRSLKGNKNKQNQHQLQATQPTSIKSGKFLISADDQLNSYTTSDQYKSHQSKHNQDNNYNKPLSRSVFGSGLATIPRKHQQHLVNNNSYPINYNYNNSSPNPPLVQNTKILDHGQEPRDLNDLGLHNNKNQTESINTRYQTLPSQVSSSNSKHQLIQSHYSRPINSARLNQTNPHQQQKAVNQSTSSMKYPTANRACNKSPTDSWRQTQQQLQTHDTNTISRIPSATEVVRSALDNSRLNQESNRIKKLINNMDDHHNHQSPSPYPRSPQTPTHQLRATSPSLSPSPVSTPGLCSPTHNKNTIQPQNQPQHQALTLHGTRIIPASGNKTNNRDTLCNNKNQPVYANPHSSLMQQQAEARLRANQTSASAREFNELDMLLKSLSPSDSYHTTTTTTRALAPAPRPGHPLQTNTVSTNTTQVTPGFSSRPTHATLGGYGATLQPSNQPSSDAYAKVQKQQQHVKSPLQPTNTNQQQHLINNLTLDVTESRQSLPRNCGQIDKQQTSGGLTSQQATGLNSYEAPTEILPSMEDYQNISKLNPVRNHFWYKPNMSRDRAIALLKDKPQGTFVVRDSNSFRGAYGLAVKVSKLPQNVLNNVALRDPNGDPSNELIRHFLIEPTANGVRVKGYANEPVFSSLPNLIYQHSLTELALPCRLIIPRADIEDPQFNLKQKQFFEDFLASKEQARHSPYERTSPNGGYRRYPGDVLIHNEHRIIFQ